MGEKRYPSVKEDIQDREPARVIEGNKSKEVGWETRSNRQRRPNKKYRPYRIAETVPTKDDGERLQNKKHHHFPTHLLIPFHQARQS
jgi:hypothetical protein